MRRYYALIMYCVTVSAFALLCLFGNHDAPLSHKRELGPIEEPAASLRAASNHRPTAVREARAAASPPELEEALAALPDRRQPIAGMAADVTDGSEVHEALQVLEADQELGMQASTSWPDLQPTE